MTGMPVGAPKASLSELPRISERLTFLYLEHMKVVRTESGLSGYDDLGEIRIPVASISVLLMGPGTSVTHRAMELICDSGTSICWVGDGCMKCFATGSALTRTSSLAEKQARAVSNKRKHLAVARQMYQMRFPDEDVSHLTMQQLRGREGSRIRSVYSRESKRTGVKWSGRSYRADDYSKSDSVNASLSIANSCLYGVAYAAICSLGCVPSLGFIHTGHQRSFVYDLADLYKTETSIPVAFDVASGGSEDLWRRTRRLMQMVLKENHILERMVHDLKYLLDPDMEDDDTDAVVLWDSTGLRVESGPMYGGDDS